MGRLQKKMRSCHWQNEISLHRTNSLKNSVAAVRILGEEKNLEAALKVCDSRLVRKRLWEVLGKGKSGVKVKKVISKLLGQVVTTGKPLQEGEAND